MKKKDETPKASFALHPFVRWAHKTGRVFTLVFMVYTILIPLVMCIVYNAWPSFMQILPGTATLLAMLGVQGVIEIAYETPILGSSSYLSNVTGNIMNLKIPCALNAQKIAAVENNTAAGDAIALISTSVSSIVTIIVLVIGLFLVIPLRPFLESEIASSASNYLMAALFGCIMVGFLAPQQGGSVIKNKLLIAAAPFFITMILAITGMLQTSAAVAMIIISIPMCLLIGRILYKKGIVRVEHRTKPEAAGAPADTESKAE